jgi:hypothetical protein
MLMRPGTTRPRPEVTRPRLRPRPECHEAEAEAKFMRPRPSSRPYRKVNNQYGNNSFPTSVVIHFETT